MADAATKPHKTRNNLDSNAKKVAIAILNERLADCHLASMFSRLSDPVNIYRVRKRSPLALFN